VRHIVVDMQRRGDRRRGAIGDVAVPIVAAAVPTAAFQLPNLFASPVVRTVLVVAGLAVLAAVVLFQVRRGRLGALARADAVDAVALAEQAHTTAVQYAFGQVATRLMRFTELPRAQRRFELGAFADRVALALAFYLLPGVPDVRANVYSLSADLTALEPIGHGGAGDTAGVFRAGTPFGDRNLEWVLAGGPPRVVGDRTTDVDADDDDPDFAPRYASYVSVVISSDDYAFGMLTVDSPTPDAFSDPDVQNVVVMATYMAVAFSLTYPLHERLGTRGKVARR
jgi:hypothetical protein